MNDRASRLVFALKRMAPASAKCDTIIGMHHAWGLGRDRRLSRVVLAVCGCALVAAGWPLADAGARVADSSALDITYTSGGTLAVATASGMAVTSGTTIPAGSYLIDVSDPDVDMIPNLTIDGPGVSFSTNLGMEVDQPQAFGPLTFAVSSTYTVEDTSIGSSSLVTFTTSAATASSGSSSAGSSASAGGAPSIDSSSSVVSGASSSHAASSSGGASTTILGTVRGIISGAGTLRLTFDGKTLKTLKAGRYTFSVVDHSMESGLNIGKGSSSLTTLSRVGVEGTTSRTVLLSVGTWFYEPTPHGPHTVFKVAS